MEDLALLALRLLLGGLFIGHGAQKLFGWFGGYGLAGTGAFMESIGLRPGRQMAALAGLSEVLGGVLFIVGLFQPLAALMIGGAMLIAIAKVHGKNGLWSQNNGYEYNLVLLVLAVALALLGPGDLSLASTLNINF
ncbi:MAG: DoxX family protein [Chloroflexi bacterium]|nr:DoxX family protein [Chloroflexota bacterium]